MSQGAGRGLASVLVMGTSGKLLSKPQTTVATEGELEPKDGVRESR